MASRNPCLLPLSIRMVHQLFLALTNNEDDIDPVLAGSTDQRLILITARICYLELADGALVVHVNDGTGASPLECRWSTSNLFEDAYTYLRVGQVIRVVGLPSYSNDWLRVQNIVIMTDPLELIAHQLSAVHHGTSRKISLQI